MLDPPSPKARPISVTLAPQIKFDTPSCLQVKLMEVLGAACGIKEDEVRRIIGAVEIDRDNSALQLSCCRTAGELAAKAFIGAAGPRLAAGDSLIPMPMERTLEILRTHTGALADLDGWPLTGEQLRGLIDFHPGKVLAIPGEMVRVLDELNSYHLRRSLGGRQSMFTRSWGALAHDPDSIGDVRSADYTAELEIKYLRGARCQLPAAQERLVDYIEQLTLELGTRAEPPGPFSPSNRPSAKSDLISAASALFRFIPPLSEPDLYGLALCAALWHESNLSRPETTVAEELDAVLQPEGKRVRHLQISVSEKAPPPFYALTQAEQLALTFLLDELKHGPTGGAGDSQSIDNLESLLRIDSFLDRAGERLFPFEDLRGAALLAKTILLVRSQPSLGGRMDLALSAAERLDAVLFNHLRAFTASYVNDSDLRSIGVAQDEQRRIFLDKVAQAQFLGVVRTRSGALHYAALLGAAAGNTVSIAQADLNRSGSDLSQFVEAVKISEKSYHNYQIRRYCAVSRRQFGDRDSDSRILQELVESENYPALNAELKLCRMQPQEVVQRLRSSRARNLVELEAFCCNLRWLRENFSCGVPARLADSLELASNAGIFALIERLHDTALRQIAICVGYQAKEHAGMGLRHFLHQRQNAGLLAVFKRRGESDEQALNRFIEDGILFVAGSGSAKVPSRKHPRSHTLLSGPIRGMRGEFLSLVLANVPDPANPAAHKVQVVTALYHSSAKALRACLKRELAGWAEKADEDPELLRLTDAKAMLAAVNALLRDAGQSPITESEIEFFPKEGGLIAAMSSFDDGDMDFGGVLEAGIDEEIDSLDIFDRDRTAEEPESQPLFRGLGAKEPALGKSLRARAAAEGPDQEAPKKDEDYELAAEGFMFNPGAAALL